jgi:hypothetical protein
MNNLITALTTPESSVAIVATMRATLKVTLKTIDKLRSVCYNGGIG